MEFDVIDFSNKNKWSKLAKNSEIYYWWQYVDAFYQNGEGIPFLVYAVKNNNYVFNVFLKRDISEDERFKGKIDKGEFFDISTPYGYGGVNIVGEEDKELLKYFFDKFSEYCKSNGIISEFVRLNPLSDNYSLYSDAGYDIINISKTVFMKLDSEEQIWNDMESRCRNTIRKAIKSNLIIKSGFSEEMLCEFMNIYNETMKRDSAKEYYFFKKQFFENIQKNMRNHSKIYTAYLEDKAISSLIVIYNDKNAHYHLSGSLSDYMNLGANNLLLYEVAKDLCKIGYQKLHLGGGYGGDNSPLLKFKKSFNKNGELNFYIGKKIMDVEKYEKLVMLRKKDKTLNVDSGFFPIYRG